MFMVIFMQASQQGTKTAIRLHVCLKSLPRDRYPAYHPSVLSCKQQTIALNIVHDVCKIYNNKDINTAVLILVASAHPWSYMFLSLKRWHIRGQVPTIYHKYSLLEIQTITWSK